MKLQDIAKYSFKSLQRRQMRSWLTIIGIVIGIAAVVSLLTIGQGFSDEVEKQLASLGSRTVFVAPISAAQASSFTGSPNTSPTAGKLFEKDAERLKRIGEIEDITKMVSGRGTVDFKNKQITATVSGIEPGVFEKTTVLEVESGRFLDDSDQRVAVIGSLISTDYFDNDKVTVNSFINVNGRKFRVIGILKKSAGGFGPSAQLDNAIMIPYHDAQEIFKTSLAENEVSAILVTLREDADVDEVAEKMTFEIANSHKVPIDDRDFSVLSPKALQERIGSIIGMVTGFLAVVASISLIVGGVGIANTMFMSVIERTKEIGILKSIGGTRGDILKIFVFESGAIGGVGGALGSLLGVVVVVIANSFGAPASIRFEILIFAFLFSVIVGVTAGIIPARRAADLSAVEALRYE